MEFLEAVIKSIQSYYEGNAFEASSANKEIKYSKDYFDGFEEEEFGDKEVEKAPKEAPVDPKRQEMLVGMLNSQEDKGEVNAPKQ